MLGYKMAALTLLSEAFWKALILAVYLEKSKVMEANRLEPRSGPTHVGPDLGSSLFASSCILFWKILPKKDVFQINGDNFFKAAILYPSTQWVCSWRQMGSYRVAVDGDLAESVSEVGRGRGWWLPLYGAALDVPVVRSVLIWRYTTSHTCNND